MVSPNKARGDRAEREAAELIANLLGVTVRRKLGAGRTNAAGGDTGDLEGVPDHAIQVANWVDLATALRHKPAAALIRLRGGDFRVCMTPLQWADYLARYTNAEVEVHRLRDAIRHVKQHVPHEL